VLDSYLKPSEAVPTNVPVLLAKLGDADRLLEDMRRMLTGIDSEGQSVYRVEEVIASLKRLRWCLESQIEDGRDGGQTEAILRFSS
jgi:hypothetical protein